MKLLLIGNGVWGKNYIQTFSTIPNVQLIVAEKSNWKQLIDNRPDGVIISTQPQLHIDIAHHSLSLNIPTMIEKPLALSLNESLELEKYQAPILVNHLHIFSTGYENIKQLCKNNISSILSFGHNNTPDRNYSSLWDYGVHDLSMILDLLNKEPNKIKISIVDGLYYLDMFFDNCITSSVIGNKGTHKARKIIVTTHDGIQLSYNDILRPSSHVAPLRKSVDCFINAINGIYDYRLGLDISIKISKILEECDKQLNI